MMVQWRYCAKACADQPVIHDLRRMNSKMREITSDMKLCRQSKLKLSVKKGTERSHDND